MKHKNLSFLYLVFFWLPYLVSCQVNSHEQDIVPNIGVAETPDASTDCDPDCLQATLVAQITPGPTVTYNPTMVEKERVYNLTLEATTPEPTLLPPYPAPLSTPEPGSEPGTFIYRGRPLYSDSPFFEVNYDGDLWVEESKLTMLCGDFCPLLSHQDIPDCTLMLRDSPGDARLVGVVELAGLEWSITRPRPTEDPNYQRYGTMVENDVYHFGIVVPKNADEATQALCRQDAEAVLDTFTLIK